MSNYPNVPHDDDLDALAMAMEAALGYDVLDDDTLVIEGHSTEVFDQADFRGSP